MEQPHKGGKAPGGKLPAAGVNAQPGHHGQNAVQRPQKAGELVLLRPGQYQAEDRQGDEELGALFGGVVAEMAPQPGGQVHQGVEDHCRRQQRGPPAQAAQGGAAQRQDEANRGKTHGKLAADGCHGQKEQHRQQIRICFPQ